MTQTVSVVIPTYNRKQTVQRSIGSVLSQTVRPDQIVVVDDGSRDGSAELLHKVYGDAIELIVQENAGASAARNRGVLHSSGDLVAFLDSDDKWDQDKLSQQIAALEGSDVVLNYTNWRQSEGDRRDWFSEIGLELPEDCTVFQRPLELLTRWDDSGAHLSGTLCRRDPLMRTGLFDVSLRIAEDTKFFLNMAREGSFSILSRPLWSRSATADHVQLTMRESEAYHREHTRIVVPMLEGLLAAAPSPDPIVRRNVRRLLGYFAMKEAKFLALDCRFAEARRTALKSIGYSPLDKAVLSSAAIALAPATARRLLLRRQAKPSDSFAADSLS